MLKLTRISVAFFHTASVCGQLILDVGRTAHFLITLLESSVFKDRTDTEIIQMYGLLLKELRSRKIIRSKNIVGDLGERFVLDHYNCTKGLPKLQLAPPSTANVDAISARGERYSIKSTSGNVTGVFYGLPPKGSDEEAKMKFEFVVVVKFGPDHELKQIIEFTWSQFLGFKRWHSRMQAWNLPVSRKVIAAGRVVYPLA